MAIPIVYAGSWVTAAVIADAAIGAAVLAGAGWACQQADRAFNHRPSTPSYGSEPVFVGGTLFHQTSRSGFFNDELSSWLRDNPNAPPAKDHKEAIKKGWKDVGHPDQKAAGHHEVVDPETGDKWRYDEGKPGEQGHKSKGHWHHDNPGSQLGRKDALLDQRGNPCPKNSPQSHIYYE